MLSESDSERDRIQKAIAFQESLRGQAGDDLVDATIATLKEKLAALDSQSEQQRKLATILFMDFAEHSRLTHDLDPEDQMAVVDPLVTRLGDIISQHGGHVARYQGDGFKAVFGLPVAHENDPQQAIRAGLAIQDEAAVIANELEGEYDLSGFQVRVGIATGLVFAGGKTEGEDTIKGPPVNLAARLENAAEPGTVLISYDTYKFVRGIFDLESLISLQLKGFPNPMQAFKVLRAKPRAFYRGMRVVEGVETRMIGREAELEILKDAYYSVVEEKDMQMVTIIGEAGVGKSRLLYELENWVDLQAPDIRLYRGRAHLESQRLPYDLLRSIFAFRFNIQDDDSLRVVQEKWAAGFAEAWQDTPTAMTIEKVEMRAHILGQLLGYGFAESPHVNPILRDPQQIRDRSLVYLEDYFKAVASRTAVLVLLEDLHWADDSSLEALSRLGLMLRESQILIAGAARPGLYERRPYWFEGRDFHRRVELRQLSRRLNRQLVAEVLKNMPDIPRTLSDLIVSNAEGNPFYVEELVKVLVEAGVIVKGDPHWTVDAQRLEELDIPTTLTGVLQARLERLPRHERLLIQQASVVGRVFWDQAVWYLNYQGEGAIDKQGIQDGLSNLRGREMIYRRELSTFQEAREYIFKHAVLRDVTYESVLKKLRRKYHSLIAEWLMEQRAERSGEVVGLIADHLQRAGEQREALEYLKLAGQQAAQKFANEEAVDYFTRALELVPDDDLEIQFELLLGREEVLNLQAKREPQNQDLGSLNLLAEKLGSIEKQIEVGVRLSAYQHMINDYQSAASTAEQVVLQADSVNNISYAARGHFRWGKSLIWLDDYEAAQDHLESALNGFRVSNDKRREGAAFRILGLIAADLQDPLAWKKYAEQALSIARQTGDRSAEAEAINHLAHVSFELGDYQTSQIFFKQYLEFVREIGSITQEGMALSNLAWLANFKQEYSSTLDLAMQAHEIAILSGNKIGEAGAQINIGKALFGLEQYNKARDAFRTALNLYEEIGVEWGIAESQTGLAKTALAVGDLEKALTYVEAILAYLEKGKGDIQNHISVISYLICLHILSAANDARYDEVLSMGYQNLQKWAANIKDPETRESYLVNVPWNRELVQLWEEEH